MSGFSEELRGDLTRTERFLLGVGEQLSGPLFWARRAWMLGPVSLVALVSVGRRLRLHGLEHLRDIGPDSQVVLVSNHRSFFDFYTIGAACSWYTRMPRRWFFPVRSTFFYDRLLGGLVNLLLSGMSMFPPVLRDAERRHHNRELLGRLVAELSRPGTLVGLHPEGTRNKGPDPYRYLPAQPGVGKVVLGAPAETRVIPVYILGLTNDFFGEVRRNLAGGRARYPIDIHFGQAVDLAALREQGSRPATQKRAADRCLEAIAALGEQHRSLTAPTVSEPVAG